MVDGIADRDGFDPVFPTDFFGHNNLPPPLRPWGSTPRAARGYLAESSSAQGQPYA